MDLSCSSRHQRLRNLGSPRGRQNGSAGEAISHGNHFMGANRQTKAPNHGQGYLGSPFQKSGAPHIEWHSPSKVVSHHQRLVCRNHAGDRTRTNKFSWLSKPRCLPVGMSKFYSLRIRGGRRQMQPRNNHARKSINLARTIGKRSASSKRRKGRGSFFL